ncbi:M3 family metallopeptidase [Psychromicrobium sp. YIM B11713]|uniref:M3 family metallopeptidase n=1 Tax=Psychromicrobium sp. YIM B11713 TaxID=3145233 RepID=UPI00374FBC7B
MSINTEELSENPLLTQSPLPYRLPVFNDIRAEHYLPAFEQAFAEHLAEVAAIRDSPVPADFSNTAEAMERSGTLLRHVALIFFNISSADTSAELQQIETTIAPRLSAHQDAIQLDSKLYERFAQIDTSDLDLESQRLVNEYLDDFVRLGAALSEHDKATLRELNSKISELSTQFGQHSLANLNTAAVLVEEAADLDGLSSAEIAAAATAAEQAGHPGQYLLTLIQPSGQPALESLNNRELRRRLYESSISRGQGQSDIRTLDIAAQLAVLRAERAQLLGFETHAAFETANQTAPSLASIDAMLAQLAPAAVRNATAEAEALAEEAGHSIEPWDWSYYSEKVRKSRYDVDLAALKPYFELDRVLQDGVFYAAQKLYGLSFTERPDLQGYHPDVRVWEIHNEDGSGLGLFLGDYYTRDSKNGGAWMNPLVEQSGLFGWQSVVVNNLNISKPPAGEPTLLSYDEVVTCFHEFGHALHGLFSQVRYPRFSGTDVPRDFVEYPSQVNEMWILWPEVVANYARHYRSGEALPSETLEKLRLAKLWGEGFATTEYLGATLLDQAWHQLKAGVDPGDPLEFEAKALREAGIELDLIPPRYRTGYFNHIFAGGYSAGYYAYIWSEVLDAETVEWFKENDGLSRANGDRFRRELLSRGNSIDPLQAFKNFRGREARIDPLLARRGLN